MMNNTALRPANWDAYVGQEKLKSRLQISIQGALTRGVPLDHLLLCGPPGYGKTSLASLVAEEMMEDFHPFVMPLKTKALQKIFIERPGIVFLDEVHRSKVQEQEFLLSVLEDFEVNFDNGQSFKIQHPLTVIAATTDLTKVIQPLRDRFTHRPKFERYTDEQMGEIVTSMAQAVGITMPRLDALALGRASAGTPRQARSLVFTARDLGTTKPAKVLSTIGITPDGLTEDHVDYLVALNKLGQIAGIDVLSNYTGMPKDIITDLEKLLLFGNFIDFSQKGRVLTTKGLRLAMEKSEK
jgi:Holliday junction DNA helicase RuvB